MLSRLLSASGTKRSKVVCDFLSAPVCWFLFVKERVKYAKITKKYVFKCVFFFGYSSKARYSPDKGARESTSDPLAEEQRSSHHHGGRIVALA